MVQGLVAGVSLWRRRFATCSLRVEKNLAPEHVSLNISDSLVSIIPQMLYIRHHLHVSLT